VSQVPIRYCTVADVAEGIDTTVDRRARFSNKEIRALVLTKSFMNRVPPPTPAEQNAVLTECVNSAIERATKEAISILVRRNDLSLITFQTIDEVPPEIRNYVADMAAYFIIALDSSQPIELLARYERAYRLAREFFMNHVIVSVTTDGVQEIPEGEYNRSQFFVRDRKQNGERYL
jgi:phage gp36-like protein